MKCSDENDDKSCSTWEGNPKGSLWTQLSRWRWNSYGWALCTWWYFSSSRCWKKSEFCSMPDSRPISNTVPFLKCAFSHEVFNLTCFFVIVIVLDVRRGLEHPSSFVEREVRRCPSCPWHTWWFSAVNVSCDSTRQYNGPSTGSEHWQLPLRTAIATSNPSDPGSKNKGFLEVCWENLYGEMEGFILPGIFQESQHFHTVNPFHPHRSVLVGQFFSPTKQPAWQGVATTRSHWIQLLGLARHRLS